MNALFEKVVAAHQLLLASRDTVEATAAAAAAAGATLSPAGRLRRSRVMLIANGAVGHHTALRLARYPFAALHLWGMMSGDVSRMSAIRQDKRFSESNIHSPATAFDASNFGLSAAKFHLVALAVARPFPGVCEDVNKVCLRLNTPWTQLALWGAEITLGPTVIPGITACYHCYTKRRLANEPRLEVSRAQDQFLRNDSSFAFQGELAPLVNLSAAYLTAEVIRFLTGVPSPLALSREVTLDGLSQTQRADYVVPLENCPACHQMFDRRNYDSDSLGALVQRINKRRRG